MLLPALLLLDHHYHHLLKDYLLLYMICPMDTSLLFAHTTCQYTSPNTASGIVLLSSPSHHHAMLPVSTPSAPKTLQPLMSSLDCHCYSCGRFVVWQ